MSMSAQQAENAILALQSAQVLNAQEITQLKQDLKDSNAKYEEGVAMLRTEGARALDETKAHVKRKYL